MTKTRTLLGVFWSKRSKVMAKTLLVGVIASIITTLFLLIREGLSFVQEDILTTTLAVYLVLGGIFLFFYLSNKQEQVWVHNVYRLIPASSTKLYLTNLGATFLTLVSYWIIQIILIFIMGLFDQMWTVNSFFDSMAHTADMLSLTELFQVLGFIILLHIFIWTLINFTHLVTITIETFLPKMQMRIIRWVLYLVVIGISAVILNFLFGVASKSILNVLKTGTLFVPGSTPSFLMNMSVYVLAIIVFAIINIYLLGHRVESKVD